MTIINGYPVRTADPVRRAGHRGKGRKKGVRRTGPQRKPAGKLIYSSKVMLLDAFVVIMPLRESCI